MQPQKPLRVVHRLGLARETREESLVLGLSVSLAMGDVLAVSSLCPCQISWGVCSLHSDSAPHVRAAATQSRGGRSKITAQDGHLVSASFGFRLLGTSFFSPSGRVRSQPGPKTGGNPTTVSLALAPARGCVCFGSSQRAYPRVLGYRSNIRIVGRSEVTLEIVERSPLQVKQLAGEICSSVLEHASGNKKFGLSCWSCQALASVPHSKSG